MGITQTFELYKGDTINRTDASGQKQGKWVVFNKTKNLPGYTETQVIEEGRYVSNSKTGIWTGYHNNNEKKYEITYKDGLPDGYSKFYYKNGLVSEEGLWKVNRWVGRYKYNYENGQCAYDFNYNTKGKREGKQVYFHENGNVMIDGDWNDGKETGVLHEYYEDGSVKAEKSYADGKCNHGATKTYKPKELYISKPNVKQAVVAEVKPEPKPDPVKVVETKPVPVETKPLPKVIQVKGADVGEFNETGDRVFKNGKGLVTREGYFIKGKLQDGKTYTYDNDSKLIRVTIYEGGQVTKVINR